MDEAAATAHDDGSPGWITRYSVMPIPPVEAHTQWFEAGGDLRIGVEYRLLTDAIAAGAVLAEADGSERGQTTELDDRGVSLHVVAEQDGESREFLRFDCFNEDPHYHYVNWRERANEMVHVDPVAEGDPLEWALARIAGRLPEMLARAGAPEAAARVDVSALAAVLVRVGETARKLRYAEHDEAALLAEATRGPAVD